MDVEQTLPIPADEAEDGGVGHSAAIRMPSVSSAACECSSPDAVSKIDCECAVRTKEVVIPVDDPTPASPRRDRRETRGPPQQAAPSRQQTYPATRQPSRQKAMYQGQRARDGVARAQTHGHMPQLRSAGSPVQRRPPRDGEGHDMEHSRRREVVARSMVSPSTSGYNVEEVEFTLIQDGSGQGTCSCGSSYGNEGYMYDEIPPTRLRSPTRDMGGGGHRAYTIDEPIPEEPVPEDPTGSQGFRMSSSGYHESPGGRSPPPGDGKPPPLPDPDGARHRRTHSASTAGKGSRTATPTGTVEKKLKLPKGKKGKGMESAGSDTR